MSPNDPENKWLHLNQELRDRRIAVMIVGEAHLNSERKKKIDDIFESVMHVEHSEIPGRPNAGGVAITFNKRLTNTDNLKRWEIVPGHALQVQFEWHHGKALNVLGVYAPNSSPAVNAEFWKKVLTFYETHPNVPRPDLLGGDTNLVEEGIDRLPVKEDNEAAVMAFDALKTKLKLSDGWRRTFPDEKNYTYQHTNLKMARLDQIYVTEELFVNSREWDIEEPAVKTDHQMVSVQLTCDEAPDTGTGRWSIPDVVVKDKQFMKYAVEETHKTAEKMNDLTSHQERRTENENPQTLFEQGCAK
ncbi:DNase I-like protein [Hymenopellis radicata]|nr:DNase I-like protein [Hymenopellis radicata]